MYMSGPKKNVARDCSNGVNCRNHYKKLNTVINLIAAKALKCYLPTKAVDNCCADKTEERSYYDMHCWVE